MYPYPYDWYRPATWREMWRTVKFGAPVMTLVAFIVLRKQPHWPTGQALGLTVLEAGPGCLVIAWWTLRATRRVWRGILWLRSRLR